MIGYFSRHPTAANLLMVVIILAGVLGISAMRREVFPEFDSDFVRVEVVYRGTSAEEIEETICQRIERELEGISGIEQVYSTAREGLGTLHVEVADGYEVQEVLADVENAVDGSTLGDLSSGVNLRPCSLMSSIDSACVTSVPGE